MFLTKKTYNYDKTKVNYLKSILPIFIIILHIPNDGIPLSGLFGQVALYFFFAMSGYGLVFSYMNRQHYLDNFLKKHLARLFTPYFIALVALIAYKVIHNQSLISHYKESGFLEFVPYLWFVWILASFYTVFFFVFKYVKANSIVKVSIVSLFVLAYFIVFRHLGFQDYLYFRCPAFCAGMFCAMFENKIKQKLRILHCLAILFLCLTIFATHLLRDFESIIWAIILFTSMYLIKDLNENKVIQFFSSISYEMYIVQFLPISIILNDLKIQQMNIALPLIITSDIILAYIMHRAIEKAKTI